MSDSRITVKYLDIYTTDELRALVAKGGKEDPDAVVPVDYVSTGREDYRGCIDRQFDFIIANHVFEHIVDPVSWLQMLGELLNPGGHLLLTIPDNTKSFDRFRDETTFAHIMWDYLADVSWEQKAQVHAYDTSLYYDRSYVNQTITPESLFDPIRIGKAFYHPGVHCHVFKGATFINKIMKPLLFTKLIDYTLVDVVEKSPWGEFNVVLRKGWTPFEFTLEEFYQSRKNEDILANKEGYISPPSPAVTREGGDAVETRAEPGVDLFKTESPGFNQQWLETRMIRQTLIFYNELLPVLFQCCMSLWRGTPLTVADIGTNSGAGAAHLSDVLNNLTGFKVEMTGFDTDVRYSDYAHAKFPQIEFVGGDFFDDRRRFDLAICSHTLEHIPDPVAFVERVLSRLNGAAIFYVPYKEVNLIPGHVNRFDDALLRSMPGIVWTSVRRSVGWRTEGDLSRCAMFVCVAPSDGERSAMINELRRRLNDEMQARSIAVRQPGWWPLSAIRYARD